MIRAILVEDEPKALEVLKTKLNNFCPQIEVVGMAGSSEEAYELILRDKPQLLFLDIAMPRESGMDLLKRLPDLNFELIFITGFSDYALEAIQFCAIGYVVKPIENKDLLNAVANAERRIALKVQNQQNQSLLANLANPDNGDNQIVIPIMDGYEFVKVNSILRCEGIQRCTKIVLKDNSILVSSYNLGEFVKKLKNFKFFSPHRSHLINLRYLKKYSREGHITLTNGESVPVAKRKKQEFIDLIKNGKM